MKPCHRWYQSRHDPRCGPGFVRQRMRLEVQKAPDQSAPEPLERVQRRLQLHTAAGDKPFQISDACLQTLDDTFSTDVSQSLPAQRKDVQIVSGDKVFQNRFLMTQPRLYCGR